MKYKINQKVKIIGKSVGNSWEIVKEDYPDNLGIIRYIENGNYFVCNKNKTDCFLFTKQDLTPYEDSREANNMKFVLDDNEEKKVKIWLKEDWNGSISLMAVSKDSRDCIMTFRGGKFIREKGIHIKEIITNDKGQIEEEV